MSIAVAKRAGTDPGRTSQHRVWGWLVDRLGSRGWILLVLFLLLLVVASIVPDVFAPYDHEAQNLRSRLLGPGESSPEGSSPGWEPTAWVGISSPAWWSAPASPCSSRSPPP